MSRKDNENKRVKGKPPELTPTDKIIHSLELADLDMTSSAFNDCTERFKKTFK